MSEMAIFIVLMPLLRIKRKYTLNKYEIKSNASCYGLKNRGELMDKVLKKLFSTRLFIPIILVVFSSQLLLASQEDLAVELVPSKRAYTAGDSIILALKIIVPEKYHLYGNPLGPRDRKTS